MQVLTTFKKRSNEQWNTYTTISKILIYQRKYLDIMNLKVPSYKLYNNKYMIASIQITNTEIFEFISVLVLKLLSRNGLFTNRKRQ